MKRLFKYTKNSIRFLIFGNIFLLLGSFFTSLIPYICGQIIDGMN